MGRRASVLSAPDLRYGALAGRGGRSNGGEYASPQYISIEGASFVAGDRPSPSVERAVAELADELNAERR